MHTPFQILRSKQRTRRQRIALSLSPTKHSFSLENSRPLSQKCKSSQINLSLNRRKTVFSQTDEVWRKNNQTNSVEKYQIKVQNTLKRMANYRQAIGKNKMRLNEITVINWMPNKDKNLKVEGENCGEDLIRQNRRKLEKMAAQYNPQTVQPSQNNPPDIVMGKSRHNKFKRLLAERQDATQKAHASQRKKNHKKSFNANEFLICNNLQRSAIESEKSTCVLVLNKNQISNYIKDLKKRKYIPSKVQSESGEKCNLDLISKKACITYNFFTNPTKNTSSNFHNKQKDSQYYLTKKSFFENSRNREKKKGIIINGFDTKNLQGWQQQQGDQCQLLQMTSPTDNFQY